jgi:energy-coupling factor transporter ATP-binding protein EcfA2
MISFSRISKQYGRQVLFVDATFQLNPGEKVGLVGPNGSGKTTLFRMIVGEEHQDEGEVSVPKRLTIGYSDDDAAKPESPSKEKTTTPPSAPTPGSFLWWCDGPCGTAKAALSAQARESSLGQIDIPSEPTKLVTVIRKIAAEIKSNKAPGALLMTQSAAAALVFANRCPSLRAIVGTCLETVEQGLNQVAANVLIIEYPHKTLQQIRNLIARFVKAKRELSEETKKSLQELTTCG